MSPTLFSATVFVVVFREALEAALIVSVLFGLLDQIVIHKHPTDTHAHPPPLDPESNPTIDPRTLRKLRLQIVFGTLTGIVIAVAVGGAFVAIWFTQAKNLWSTSEQLWEGVFLLIASLMIFVMGVTMLKMEHARTKWRIKLQNAFNNQSHDRNAQTGKWILFILPMVTVLREGVEGVVFVGGVTLGQPATSVPISAIVGIICGLICGVVVYQFASRSTFKVFLICMTNLILLIGAGLFSKAVWAFQENAYLQLIGTSGDDAVGTGPGSYDVHGNVWNLNCCSAKSGAWSIFYAIFGWENSATLGSILSYVFYWLAVIAVLVYYKFREGRTKIFGYESARGRQRRQRHEAEGSGQKVSENPTEQSSQAEVTVAGQTDLPAKL